MTETKGLESAIQLLRASSSSQPELDLGASEAEIAALGKHIRRQAAARRQRRVLVPAFALSAAAAVVLGFWATASSEIRAFASPRQAGASMLVSGRAVPVGALTPLEVGAELRTETRGGVEVSLTTGTKLQLEPNGVLRLASLNQDQQFRLNSGRLAVQVHKLSAGERFRVFTPNATIEVHGTKFQILVDPAHLCSGSATQVEVSEGMVSVDVNGQSLSLRPNERWPVACTSPRPSPVSEPEPPSSQVKATPVPAKAGPAPSRSVHRKSEVANKAAAPVASVAVKQMPLTPPARADASTLAAQNDQFTSAVSREKAGDTMGALAAYEDFLQKYPNSALSENAAVGRLRMLSKTNPVRARESAQSYLKAHPLGIGRAVALKLIGAEKSP